MLAGAVALPVVVLAVLVALGYNVAVPREALRGEAHPGQVLALLGALAAAGAVLGAAVERRYRVTAAVAVGYAAFAVRDPLFGPGPAGYTDVTAFAGDAVFLAVLSVLAFAATWVVANPSTVWAYATPRALRVAVVAGLAHLALAVVARGVLFGLPWGGRSLVAVGVRAWMVVGAFLLGAVPGFLAARERLATPALVVLAGFAWAFVETWRLLDPLEPAGPALAAAITPISLYLVAWVVVVALASAVGLAERWLRRAFGG